MKRNIYLSLVFIMLFAFALPAQKLKIKTANTAYPPASVLSEEERAELINTTEQMMNDYAQAATLLDKDKKRVTVASVNHFRSFFGSTAEVVVDYEEVSTGELINYRSYSDAVFSRMELQGLQVRVGELKLKEIINDAAGYWVLVLEADKLIYNYVNSNNQVEVDAGGRMMKQEMRIDIRKTKPEKAKITKISCIGCGAGVIDDYVQYIGPSISLFNPIVSAKMSEFWTSNHDDSEFSNSGNLSFSAGIDIMTNKFAAKSSSTKPLFLTGGIHLYLYRFSSSLNDFSISPSFGAIATDPNSNILDYERLATNINVTEELSIGLLAIPIGVGYRLMKNQKRSFFVTGKLIPSFVLSASGNLNGTGTYDAIISGAMWQLLEAGAANPAQLNDEDKFGPFQGGNDLTIDETANPSKSSFALAFQLSPTMYFHLSEDNSSWSLLLGLDLTFNLNSFLKHDESAVDILQFADDYDTSILQHYTSGFSVFSPGIRIGLQHRLISKP